MLQLELIGNLGADAQVREVGGKQYITFRAASTSRHGQAEETTWVAVMYYMNEKLLPYLKKGVQVYASGDVRISTYTNKDNKTSVDVTLWAKTLQLVGRREEQQPSQYEQQAVKDNLPRQGVTATPSDVDVPF